MKVYEKIAAVTLAMSKVGISKSRKNSQGSGYMFRGIDDVYGALSPLLAEHGLCILPRVMSRTVTEQQSKAGGLLFYTVLHVEFDFVAAEDGSKHTVCTVGEAMDSGDKSSNKAMSAAYKYACFQAFCIPLEGDNDTENNTHEVQAPPDKVLIGHLERIASAPTLEGLHSVFATAYKGYHANEAATARLVAAKDLRKAALTPQTGPQPAVPAAPLATAPASPEEASLRDALVATGIPYDKQDPPLIREPEPEVFNPDAEDVSDDAGDLYAKAAVLGGMRSKSAQDIVTEFSLFNGKHIESIENARAYLKRKPDGKWVSMTARKIEDAIRENAKPKGDETPEWAA